MKLLLLSLLAAGCLLVQAAPPAEEKRAEVPGVEGTFVRIPFDRKTAADVPEVEVSVGDEIELEWTYPIYLDAFPTKVAAVASDESLKLVGVKGVRVPTLVGVGRVGAFFKAETAGETELMLDVTTRVGVDKLRCKVKVAK
jgi:hypothetical protein